MPPYPQELRNVSGKIVTYSFELLEDKIKKRRMKRIHIGLNSPRGAEEQDTKLSTLALVSRMGSCRREMLQYQCLVLCNAHVTVILTSNEN